jgi:ribosomal protein S12 methylthiotransferase accessory factor
MSGRHLTRGTRAELPATAVLCNEDVRLGLGPVFTSSTGIAARDTVEGATRHAVMERVERDAVALWWYNRLPAPRVPAAAASDCLPDALAARLRERTRITWHLLLPHDLPAVSCVALSSRPDGSRPAMGASSSTDPATALLSATLELLQGEISLSHMRAAQTAENAPPPPPLLAWSDATNALATPHLAGTREVDLPGATTFETLLAAVDAAGIDLWIADLTRPEFEIPVVRAVSPQLRDWHPRFAPGRLFDVPVALGILPRPTPVVDLNPVPFMI